MQHLRYEVWPYVLIVLEGLIPLDPVTSLTGVQECILDRSQGRG